MASRAFIPECPLIPTLKRLTWIRFVQALIVLATCAAAGGVRAGVIKVDGSSTVYPITDAAASAFQKSRRNATNVTIGISGTGGGFRKFCRGESDIADASRPINAVEMQDCRAAGVEYLELPVAFDAVTVVVNPKNGFLTSLTIEELKRLWEPAAQGKRMTWNEINPVWPATPVKLFGPGHDSGTFDYFTEAVVGKSKSSRQDFTASEDDNVLVQGVARDTNALGYFGYAYFLANRQKLRAVPIASAAGRPPVEPSMATVANGSYHPLSRPVFIYVSVKSLGNPEVRDFIEFYLRNAGAFAAEAKYVPLPAGGYEMVRGIFKSMRKGTVFGGTPQIGMTIEELLKREGRQ